jgi:hypothetical protein
MHWTSTYYDFRTNILEYVRKHNQCMQSSFSFKAKHDVRNYL